MEIRKKENKSTKVIREQVWGKYIGKDSVQNVIFHGVIMIFLFLIFMLV